MNRTPFLSIIIICYNYEQYIQRALLSIKEQSFQDYEIIYVDDASTDNSLELVLTFKKMNPDISVTIITMEANNVIRANQLAFGAARGKYVLKNDADDWLEPEALRHFMEAAQKTDADMIVGLYQEIAEDGTLIRKRKFSKHPTKWSICEQQAGIYKTSLLHEDIIKVPPEFAIAGDAYFVAQFCMKCKNVSFLNEVVHNYFFHKQSNWNGKNQQKSDCDYYPITCFMKIVEMYDELASKTEKQEDKNYLIYAALKKFYETVVKTFSDLSWKYAIKYVRSAQKKMQGKFPDYLKNPIIILRNNGYCVIPRTVVWGLSKVERFHLWFLLYIVLFIKKPKKYIKN